MFRFVHGARAPRIARRLAVGFLAARASTSHATAQLHLYLDDIFPTTVGQPLLGKSTPIRLPFGG